jgi:NADH-quinone oxidoreductase subunit B
VGEIDEKAMVKKTGKGNIIATSINYVLGWGRKFSLFHYPFITACCGMEYMSAACAHWDFDRFGVGMTTFSPRQADLLFVVGTISHKEAPVLKTVYEQMCEPKWVIAFGACAVSGGIYDNYAVLQGIDKIIPVDVYIPGCPPRPETVLDAIVKLQNKIQNQKQDWRWKSKK